MLGLSHALAAWGSDISTTIIAALADMERASEQMVDIFEAAVERGFVTLQDIDALVQMGPQAEQMALDFIDAFQGISSEIGIAILEGIAEAAAAEAAEAAEAFADAFNANVSGLGGAISDAFSSIGRLGSQMTVEGANLRLEEIELEQRLIKIRKNNNPLNVAEAEAIRDRMQAIKDLMAQEKLNQEASFLQIQLQEDVFLTAQELNVAYLDQIEIWKTLRDAFGEIEAGTFSVLTAFDLLSIGFLELANQLLAILAGLPSAGTALPGGQQQALLTAGQPVQIFADRIELHTDSEGGLVSLGIAIP